MKRRAPGRHTRALQIGFLLVLAFSTAQVVWWVYDQSRLASEQRRWVEKLYNAETRLANELLAEGHTWPEVAPRVPQVEWVDGKVRIAPAALSAIAEERLRRLRRYGWEGSFFLVVLVACMAVIWRALHEQAELQRRQENFLAAVSHEFKSPLASLQLSLDTIRLRQPAAERLAELVERMGADLARLENLVSEVLDTANLEAGQRPLEKQAVVLHDVAREALAALTERAEAAHVDLTLDVDAALVVIADPGGVQTVLRNLLDNALRATQAAGGGQLAIRGEGDEREVRLEIRDSGIGFPPEEAENIFQKFYRVGDELRRLTRGTGLGLYIVARMMALEQGWVRAASDGPGRGATFTVAWPRPRREETA